MRSRRCSKAMNSPAKEQMLLKSTVTNAHQSWKGLDNVANYVALNALQGTNLPSPPPPPPTSPASPDSVPLKIAQIAQLSDPETYEFAPDPRV